MPQPKTFPGRGRSPPKNFYHKEHKVMEGGNEANEVSGITHSPIGEQNAGITITYRVYQPLKGGNGESEANEVTLPLEPRSGSICLAVGFNPRRQENQ